MDLAQQRKPDQEEALLDARGESAASDTLPWRPIHYLGSKLRVLNTIQGALDRVSPLGTPVCDLFAGSGTVSAWLARSRPVTAVDIQEFSRVLCGALLSPGKLDVASIESQMQIVLKEAEQSGSIFAAQPLIELEDSLLNRARNGDSEPLALMIEAGSLYS